MYVYIPFHFYFIIFFLSTCCCYYPKYFYVETCYVVLIYSEITVEFIYLLLDGLNKNKLET